MNKLGKLSLKGTSGTNCDYDVYQYGTIFDSLGAVYCISMRTKGEDGGWSHTVIYTVQSGDLFERFDNHHKSSCFEQHGANCISVHLESNEQRRLQIEKDLIKAYDPPCDG